MGAPKKQHKGRHAWVPDFVIDEIEDIKRENKIEKNNHAMTHLVKYARVGRELERIARLDWKRSQPRPPLVDPLKSSGKKKKNKMKWGLEL